ncbi:hypothetical protein U1Q18_047787, partial [Sarracenia purpurea var. burkii]
MRPVRTAKTIAKQNIRSTYQSPRSSEYSKPAPAATAMSNDEKLKNASLVQQTESKPEVTFQVPGSAKPGTSSSENKPEMSPSSSPEKSDGEYTENESNHGSPYVKSTVQKSPGYRRDPAIENDFVNLINISSETLPNLEADANTQFSNFGKKEFEPQRSITAPKVEPRPKEQRVRRTKEWWSDTEEEKALPSHPMHDSKKIYAKTKAAFRNHDARIEQTIEDVSKLTLTVDKHADLFNDMAARREELSKRVHDNSESIRGLTEHSVRFSENMSRVTAAHGTAITGLQQRFVKGMTHMKQRLDKHEEVLYQHDKAVLLLYTDVKGTAKALDEMRTSHTGAVSTQIVKVPSRTFDTNTFKNLGIVFTEKDRHHPHQFVHAFENNIDDNEVDPIHKCNLFRSLINIQDAENWKRYNLSITNYAALREEFLYEFWSDEQQEEALEAFLEDTTRNGNTREMARYMLRWIETLRHVKRLKEQDIVDKMIEKIPDDAIKIIPMKDRRTLDRMIGRLKELQRSYKEEKKPKKFQISSTKSSKNVNEQKSYEPKTERKSYEPRKPTDGSKTPLGQRKSYFKKLGEKSNKDQPVNSIGDVE